MATITLTAGNDSFIDNSGIGNIIQAGNGNDAINGAAGNDFIQAGAGNDTINGGAGSDRMQGGSGNDTFVLVKGQISTDPGSLETIIDFQGAGGWAAEQDVIRFVGFGVGSTLTYVRDLNQNPNLVNKGAVYAIFDPTDNSTVEIIIQFTSGATDSMRGGAKGTTVGNADYGWL